MADGFANEAGGPVLAAMIEVIQENRAYLSELDGAIGDGDHGVNMAKGFSMAADALAGRSASLTDGLQILGRTLLSEIGGSMGPLYGSMFRQMARASRQVEIIDVPVLATMLEAAYGAIRELGKASPGDKTLLDTLDPAVTAIRRAADEGKAFADAIAAMTDAAEAGWRSTEQLVARIGRAARLGERSRGVLDPGATSCYLLLKRMGNAMQELAAGG